MSECTWEEIYEICEYNLADKCFQTGDTKSAYTYKLNGTFSGYASNPSFSGTKSLQNVTYAANYVWPHMIEMVSLDTVITSSDIGSIHQYVGGGFNLNITATPLCGYLIKNASNIIEEVGPYLQNNWVQGYGGVRRYDNEVSEEFSSLSNAPLYVLSGNVLGLSRPSIMEPSDNKYFVSNSRRNLGKEYSSASLYYEGTYGNEKIWLKSVSSSGSELSSNDSPRISFDQPYINETVSFPIGFIIGKS